jgi:signal transduction histidine kinase
MNIKEKSMSLKQNTKRKTGAVRKAVQNKQISIIIISLLLLIIILFYFSFKHTKLKQKKTSKTFKVKFKKISCFRNWARNRTKKIANFLHDNISALLSSAGLHLSVFSSKIR